MLIGTIAQAQVKVEKVIPQKGYILSIDLFQKKCEKIWTQQIPLFKKNNPKIENPDILSIGKEIQVQNCMHTEEKPQIQEPTVSKQEKKSKEPEEKKSGIFVSIGGQFNSINKKDTDEGKHGSGYRADIGKRIKNKQEIKMSLGVINNETKTDSDLSLDRILLALDVGYLYNVNSKIKIGPNAEILYNSISSSFKNAPNRETINPYLGINGEVKLYKDLFLDLKVQKSINERMDFVNSVSLGLDF
jgi:hypothetical protein